MNWMVNPDSQLARGKVQNLTVLGWAIVQRSPDGKTVRRLSLELYQPNKVPEGLEVVPLTAVELCPDQPSETVLQPNKTLIATCRRNLAMNLNSVPARFVLEQLGEMP